MNISHLRTKPTKWMCSAKIQISLGIRQVWSESSLFTQRTAKDPSFLHAPRTAAYDLGLHWLPMSLLWDTGLYGLKRQTHLSHLMTKPTMWLCAQRRPRSAWDSFSASVSVLVLLSSHHLCFISVLNFGLFEPPHDKTNEMACAPSEDSDQHWHPLSLIRVFAVVQWVAKGSEDSDETGRMHRLFWVFAGRTLILLVLSCRGSFLFFIAKYF